MKKRLLFASLLACLFIEVNLKCLAQKKITASEASNYIGETCEVIGMSSNVRIFNNDKGGVIFIHLEKPYPHNTFKVVIFGQHFGKFKGNIETSYTSKKLKVIGVIGTDLAGKPQIIVNDPSEISIIE